MQITRLERRPTGKRISLYSGESPVATVSPEVCAQFEIREGSELDERLLSEIQRAEAHYRGLQSALRLLSYRPRSEAELRERLSRRGSAGPVTEEVIERLRQLGLVDDEAFARSWVESREAGSPRGRRLIASELRRKGVGHGTTITVLASINEEESAYRAALRRARSWRGVTYPECRRRLGDFLLRRGFDYELIESTVARVWGEVREDLTQMPCREPE